MGNLYFIEGLVKSYILATDDALIKFKGKDKVLHKSSMRKGIAPC